MDNASENTPLLATQSEASKNPPTQPLLTASQDASEEEIPNIIPNGVSTTLVLLGYLFAVMAGVCFTSSNVLVKFLPGVSSWELLFLRSTLQIVFTVCVMVAVKENPLGPREFSARWRIVTQGLMGGLLLLAIFMAVSLLPLGDATAIFFSSPAFTMILSYMLIRDHCGVFRTLISLLLLGGVVVLSRPPAIFPPAAANSSTNASTEWEDDVHKLYDGRDESSDKYNALGLAAAFAVPILSAWIVIVQRQVKYVHLSVLVFWFGIGGFVVSLIGMFGMDKVLSEVNDRSIFSGNWGWTEWVLSLLVVHLGILGSVLMTKVKQSFHLFSNTYNAKFFWSFIFFLKLNLQIN